MKWLKGHCAKTCDMAEVKTKMGHLVMAEEAKIDLKALEAITKKVLGLQAQEEAGGDRE